MSDSDELIQEYIKKVLRIQQEKKEMPLNASELQKVAEELGLSMEDMDYIKKKREDYVARGKGYSRYEDWDSAIDEFRQAVILSPNDVESLYGLANAYKNRWLLRHRKDDANLAKTYVKKALQINANHDPSFKLASELNRGTATYTPGTAFKSFNTDFQSINDSFKDLYRDNLKDVFDSELVKTNNRLKKSQRDKKIFGVCAGVAEYFGIDPTWVRIIFILGALFGGGFSIPLYILLTFIMPKY